MPLSRLSRLALLILLSALSLFGQAVTCSFTSTLTTPGAGSAFDNRFRLCSNWQINISQSGFTAEQFQIEGAPDVAGSPGAYVVLTAAQGSNPNFSVAPTVNLSLAFSAGNYDWLRFNLISQTTAGTMTATANGTLYNPPPGPNHVYAIVNVPYSANPVFNISNGDQKMILTGDVAQFAVIGIQIGSIFSLQFCQDVTASHVITSSPSYLVGFQTGIASDSLTCTSQPFESFDGLTATAISISTGAPLVPPSSCITWLTRAKLCSPADGILLINNNAQTGSSRLDFGGTTASFPSILRAGTVLKFKLSDGSNDSGISVLSVAFQAFGSMIFPSDGVTTLLNNAATGFNRLQFGGTTTAFPSLARTGTVLSAQLGDGSAFSPFQASVFQTGTNCTSNATPAVCGSASAGSVSVAPGATTLTINTTAVTANSSILIMFDGGLTTKQGITCNGNLNTNFQVSARTAGTSFQIALGTTPVTNAACFNYLIIN